MKANMVGDLKMESVNGKSSDSVPNEQRQDFPIYYAMIKPTYAVSYNTKTGLKLTV